MRVFVAWDTDGEDIVGLPNPAEVPNDIEEDEIADWLSDEYGWCVKSWLPDLG